MVDVLCWCGKRERAYYEKACSHFQLDTGGMMS